MPDAIVSTRGRSLLPQEMQGRRRRSPILHPGADPLFETTPFSTQPLSRFRLNQNCRHFSCCPRPTSSHCPASYRNHCFRPKVLQYYWSYSCLRPDWDPFQLALQVLLVYRKDSRDRRTGYRDPEDCRTVPKDRRSSQRRPLRDQYPSLDENGNPADRSPEYRPQTSP